MLRQTLQPPKVLARKATPGGFDLDNAGIRGRLIVGVLRIVTAAVSVDDTSKRILRERASRQAAGADGSTPLHEAVRRMNTGSVAALCRFGADRRAEDHAGRTPADLLTHEDGKEERALMLAAMS